MEKRTFVIKEHIEVRNMVKKFMKNFDEQDAYWVGRWMAKLEDDCTSGLMVGRQSIACGALNDERIERALGEEWMRVMATQNENGSFAFFVETRTFK